MKLRPRLIESRHERAHTAADPEFCDRGFDIFHYRDKQSVGMKVVEIRLWCLTGKVEEPVPEPFHLIGGVSVTASSQNADHVPGPSRVRWVLVAGLESVRILKTEIQIAPPERGSHDAGREGIACHFLRPAFDPPFPDLAH